MAGGQCYHQWAYDKSFHLEISIQRSRTHESNVRGPCLESSNLADRVQSLDFDLDLAMESAEVTEDTGNGHELCPRGACNRETITPAPRSPTGSEHRTVRLRQNLPRML